MWYVWFKIGGEVAHLVKGYKMKATAVKLGNKVFGKGGDFIVSQENPYEN